MIRTKEKITHSLLPYRKVVWKHLLNVYPEGLTGRERLDYMKQKTKEYEGLKAVWQEHLQNEEVQITHLLLVFYVIHNW